MKSILIALLFLNFMTYGQTLKTRNVAYALPALNTKINGLAIGLIINSLKTGNETKLKTQVNGICIEIIGLGILLPLVGSDPIYTEPDSVYLSIGLVDSIAHTFNFATYKINGFVVSAGGVSGHDIFINGVNFSGLNTLLAKINGFSTAFMFNMSGVLNGVSIAVLGNQSVKANGVQIGLFNNAISLKGLQFGLINSAKHLKGLQIGLWNNNGKRKLPIINWQFKVK
jgi:hypothetical protein